MKPRLITTHGKRTVFVSKQLSNCSHVFLYNNVINSSLQPVHLGPYAVRARKDKYFDIEIQGKVKRVSIDRLKPGSLLKETDTLFQEPYSKTPEHKTIEENPRTENENKTTRTGRRVKFPSYLKDYLQ
ncbi:retrovirus-related Pol polyprotein from transposon TNT 1-94 [Nephila pilipes]|uniref:Retrovirus-related Pol polyprotein from transposon TNT 1-94 n=1 Tax=Nephila pilipes TaxID=299642 RepID=A0A8X6N615_NEPPI|nr:retrovirus-related Pol polyprotein from transposon TNT 1-94 [Nephila pilipes]